MRKVAGTRVALALGLVAFTACQSADRSPLGSTATEPGQDQAGTASAAVDPVPVPGKPGPVPVPGRGGSTTKIPVPGSPSKGPGPGSPATPPPTPGTPPATPTPTAPPLPTVKLTFQCTTTPTVATGPFPTAACNIAVNGVTGPVRNLTVAYRATIPNNNDVDEIRLAKQTSIGLGFASLYADTNEPKLSGADLGTNCTPFGGATTSDDKVGVLLLSEGSPPYGGVFRTEGTLTGLAASARTPADANGDWIFQLLLEAGGVATLECVTLTVEYQP